MMTREEAMKQLGWRIDGLTAHLRYVAGQLSKLSECLLLPEEEGRPGPEDVLRFVAIKADELLYNNIDWVTTWVLLAKTEETGESKADPKAEKGKIEEVRTQLGGLIYKLNSAADVAEKALKEAKNEGKSMRGSFMEMLGCLSDLLPSLEDWARLFNAIVEWGIVTR